MNFATLFEELLLIGLNQTQSAIILTKLGTQVGFQFTEPAVHVFPKKAVVETIDKDAEKTEKSMSTAGAVVDKHVDASLG